jgi:hypothetical protein
MWFCFRALFPTVAVGLLIACSDTAPAPFELDLRLESTDWWSGGELTVVTPPAGPESPVFAVYLDDVPLALRQTDPGTFVATLPDLPGQHRLTATVPGGSVTITPGVIRLHGFRERRDRAPLKGNLYVWPSPGGSRVLGVGRKGPALLDLASGAVLEWPDTIHGAGCNLGGVGPSWRPDNFVLQGARPGLPAWDCGGYRPGRLMPTPELAAIPRSPPRVTRAWGSAEVAADRWLFTTDDHLFGYDCRNDPCVDHVDLYWTGGAWEVFLSPRGDRVLVNGLPRVLDPETLEILYSIDSLPWAEDATFSPAGDTLLVVGRYGGTARVRAFRPDDGAMLADLPLTGPGGGPFYPAAAAFDPVAPWIYVVGTASDWPAGVVALLVVDRASLEAVALLHASPDQAIGVPPPDGWKIVPAVLEGAIYVVLESLIYNPPTRGTPVYRFDRRP